MMLSVLNRAKRGGMVDIIRRNELGTLVDKLVERKLAVRTQCAPYYWLWKEDISSDLNLWGSIGH